MIIDDPGSNRNTRHHIQAWMLLLLATVMLCAGCQGRETGTMPRATGGVLDIRGVDFTKTGPIPLNGEWEFYWNSLLMPKDFTANGSPPPSLFVLPGTWKSRSRNDMPLNRTGQATYRLHIIVNSDALPLELKLIDIQQAYRLWANGKLVAQSGVVGRSTQEETPQRSLRLAKITPRNGDVELVLQVSNHHFRTGGIPEPIVIAPAEMLERQRTQGWALSLFFAGSILIIGIYHLTIYLMRRRETAPLYFGLYCLLTVAYIVNSNTSGWVMTLITPTINPSFMENFALFCYMAWPSMRFRFFQTIYPDEFHKIIYRLGDIRTIVFIGFLLFAPGIPLYWYVLGCLLLSLFFGFYNVQRLVVCVRRDRVGAGLMLTGCSIHMVAGINDVMVHAGWLNSTYVVEIGMFLFALFQAIALARYFTSAFDAVAQLSGELEDKNRLLLEEMAERDKLAHEVVNISEDERRRISHELHDGLCQKLTGARLHAVTLKKRLGETEHEEDLTLLSELLNASINDAYNTSRGLWPVEQDPDMPGPSLSDLARTISDATSMHVNYEKHLWCSLCINPDATTLYRIAQEALTNAVKHSQAQNVNLKLRCEQPTRLVLTVHDDGIGCEAASKSDHGRAGGLGLGIMKHRARIIGAKLRIEDAPNGGTLVTCSALCPSAPTNKQIEGAENDEQ